MADSLALTPIALVDLLDRVLATGVVISGEIVLSIADVDLVYVSLRALLSSVSSVRAVAPQPFDPLAIDPLAIEPGGSA